MHLTVVAFVCLRITCYVFQRHLFDVHIWARGKREQCPTSQISVCSTRTFERFNNNTLENKGSVLSLMVPRTFNIHGNFHKGSLFGGKKVISIFKKLLN